jgi:hypothetical protein
MLARAIAGQRFEMIARRETQILQLHRRIECRQHGARAFDQIAGKAFGEASGNRFVANFLHHNQG